ncbi:hypothetical protein [Streptomyces vinaceus]|uniref:hypothetical protein n=1 Tax=Streptomyces vinaceus TaxID=1960 RepID=UPI00367635A6
MSFRWFRFRRAAGSVASDRSMLARPRGVGQWERATGRRPYGRGSRPAAVAERGGGSAA